jgi:thiosulfate reductase cytochrome b subunit
MKASKPNWQGQQLNDLQGPSSLGMALSGGAVAYSATILNPNVYLGFWMSFAFQAHAVFQFLAVAFGVMFFLLRLRNNDVMSEIERARREGVPAVEVERLQERSRHLARRIRSTIYAQIVLLSAGAVSFIWLMLLHFHRALYP